MSIIEKAARAAYTKWRENLGTGAFPRWEDIPPTTRELYMAAQRVAIEAMREPTAWMIDRMTPELSIAEHAWRAGIDATLTEKQP